MMKLRCLILGLIVSCMNDSTAGSQVEDSSQIGGIEKFSWIYLSEHREDGFTPVIAEETIDRRWSNLIFFHSHSFVMDKNLNRLKSSDPEVIEEYKRYISGPEVDKIKCTEHLQRMVNLLEDLQMVNARLRDNISSSVRAPTDHGIDTRHIRLAKVLDSYGHYPGGALESNEYVLGMQKQCLETKLQFDSDRSEELIGTRSCMAKLDMAQQMSPVLTSEQRPGSYTHLIMEICIPNTCHANSLASNRALIQKLVDSQFVLPESLYVDQSRPVVDLFCFNDHNETIGFPTSGRLFLVFACCWLLIMLIVTLRNERSSILDKYFSIKQSIDDFIGRADAIRNDDVDYDALNGLRVLCTVGVVIGHTLMTYYALSKDVPRVVHLVESDPRVSLYMQLNLLVNTFFIMSGMIITHMTLRKLQHLDGKLNMPTQVFVCLRLIAGRYLKIVPLYFLLFWFRKGIYLYINYGPLMDRGYNQDTLIGACKTESFLTPLLGLAAYKSLMGQCLPPAWSLACELFFIVVGAPLIVLISRRPKLGLSLTVLLMAASVWSQYYDFSTIKSDNFNLIDKQFMYTILSTGVANSTKHSKSHNRISTYLVGVLFGYFLHWSKWDESKRWPRWFGEHMTRMAILVVSAPIFVGLLQHHLMQFVPKDLTTLLFVLILGQVIWPASNAVLLIRMMTDWKSSYIVQLSRGSFWRAISKLGLGILLIHGDLMYLSIVTAPSSHYSSSAAPFGSIYLTAFMLSLTVHLVFEQPMDKMAKDLLNFVDRCLMRPSRARRAGTDFNKND